MIAEGKATVPRRVIAATCLFLAAAAAGCSSSSGAGSADTGAPASAGQSTANAPPASASAASASAAGASSAGPTTLKSVAQLRPLTKLSAPCPDQPPQIGAAPDPTTALVAADPSGSTCYSLGPAIAQVRQLTKVTMSPVSGSSDQWTVTMTFMPTEQQAIAEYTATHHSADPTGATPDTVPADYLAILVKGQVLESVDVTAPVNAGLQITGISLEQATTLFAAMSGG